MATDLLYTGNPESLQHLRGYVYSLISSYDSSHRLGDLDDDCNITTRRTLLSTSDKKVRSALEEDKDVDGGGKELRPARPTPKLDKDIDHVQDHQPSLKPDKTQQGVIKKTVDDDLPVLKLDEGKKPEYYQYGVERFEGPNGLAKFQDYRALRQFADPEGINPVADRYLEADNPLGIQQRVTLPSEIVELMRAELEPEEQADLMRQAREHIIRAKVPKAEREEFVDKLGKEMKEISAARRAKAAFKNLRIGKDELETLRKNAAGRRTAARASAVKTEPVPVAVKPEPVPVADTAVPALPEAKPATAPALPEAKPATGGTAEAKGGGSKPVAKKQLVEPPPPETAGLEAWQAYALRVGARKRDNVEHTVTSIKKVTSIDQVKAAIYREKIHRQGADKKK